MFGLTDRRYLAASPPTFIPAPAFPAGFTPSFGRDFFTFYRGVTVDAWATANQYGGIAVTLHSPQPFGRFMQIRRAAAAIRLRKPPGNGQRFMVAGLAMLIAAAWSPHLPVVSPMAFVALGATAATITQLAHHRLAAPLLIVHWCVYGGLYAFFLGAVWHAVSYGPQPGWRPGQLLDLAGSLCIMTLASQWVFVAAFRHVRGEDATVL
jgi:hypothetical protein